MKITNDYVIDFTQDEYIRSLKGNRQNRIGSFSVLETAEAFVFDNTSSLHIPN